MAWRQTGDKPLPETIMVQFTDVFMHNSVSMIQHLGFDLPTIKGELQANNYWGTHCHELTTTIIIYNTVSSTHIYFQNT